MVDVVDVDKECLLRLQTLMGMQYPQLIKSFLVNVENYIDAIDVALRGGDHYTAHAVAHKMKSSCGQFGLVHLQNLARQIEHGEDSSNAMAGLTPAYRRAREFLQQAGLD